MPPLPTIPWPPLRAVLLAATILLAVAPGRAAEPRTTFAGSNRPLTGQAAATSRALSARELAGTMDLGVLLRLRDADELQARVNRNEVIPYAEMEARYLPLPADYETVARWLRGEGFTVTRQDRSRLGVFVRGTLAQVQKSFQATLVHVTVDGIGYPAAGSAPSLPASVAGPVLGVVGLHPYLKLHPHNRQIPLGAAKTGVAAMDFNLNPASYPVRSFSPAQIITAFDGASLSYDGTGQRIAILADTLPAMSDLTAFWSRQGVTRTGAYETSTPNGTSGTTTPGNEVTLDTEWSSSIAPGANVRVYAAGSTYFNAFGNCLQQMISDIGAGVAIQQLSISYGLGEADAGSGAAGYFMYFDNQYMLTLAGLGVSIFASTGDDGSTFDGAAQVSYYSSSPNIAAVGGTSLGVNADGTHLGENAWSGSGGGASIVFNRPVWQTGPGVPTGTSRLVPDVSLPADPYTGCDLTYNGLIYDANGNTSGQLEGGTSWSSPTWAGFMARINQARTANARSVVGLLSPHVYPLIGTGDFFDVTTGSNAPSGSTIFTAGVGYDETTGIGSPDVTNLLNTLLLPAPTITGFTPASGTVGSSVVITGTNFYYVGNVLFNGVASTAYTVDSATQITATVPTGATTGKITVAAASDSVTSATNYTVIPAPDLTITKSHAGSFTQADAADTYTITVTNGGTAATSGTVTMTDTLPTGLTATGLSGTGWTIAPGHLSATRNDTLAAGSSYPPLTLTVGVSSTAAASVTNMASVSGGGETNTANDTASDPTTITALTPSQSWRYQYFGTTANTGNAADTANPSGDGLPNLLKYALGLDPTVPTANPETEDTSTGYLRLTVPRNANATDITYSVQVTSDLTDPASWTTATTPTSQNTATTLQFQDNTPVSGTAKRFIRLQISR